MLFGGVGGAGFGGAIFTTNGSLSIVNCSLNSNLCTSAAGPLGASFGGAVFQSSGFLAITNGIFLGNLALGGSAFDVLSSGPEPAYGGALATVSGSVAIDHSQFIGDTAKGGDAGYHTTTAPAFGGAVYCASVLAAGNSTFFGNQSLSGNGAYPAVPVTDGCGGAIYNLGSIVLNSCSICSNYTQGGYGTTYGFSPGPGGNGLGGGVFNASQLTATNCTIALNSAVSGSGSGNTGGAPLGINGNAVGGGIYNHTNATFVAMNLTIASNFCIASGPAFKGQMASPPEPRLPTPTAHCDCTIHSLPMEARMEIRMASSLMTGTTSAPTARQIWTAAPAIISPTLCLVRWPITADPLPAWPCDRTARRLILEIVREPPPPINEDLLVPMAQV